MWLTLTPCKASQPHIGVGSEAAAAFQAAPASSAALSRKANGEGVGKHSESGAKGSAFAQLVLHSPSKDVD